MRFTDVYGKRRDLPVQQITRDVCVYEDWLKVVDRLCNEQYGISIYDGADFRSFDAWESGYNPEEGLEMWEEQQDFLSEEEDV